MTHCRRPALGDGWPGAVLARTIANATVDRLMHRAHIVLTAGDGIRLTQAIVSTVPPPLTEDFRSI